MKIFDFSDNFPSNPFLLIREENFSEGASLKIPLVTIQSNKLKKRRLSLINQFPSLYKEGDIGR